MSSPHFFPPRHERPFRPDIVGRFPFPLALTYARLHDTMDAQQPVEAAWALRDAVECFVTFAASLAVADFFSHDPPPDLAARVAEKLLSYKGVAIGTWIEMATLALDPLQPFAAKDGLDRARRALPRLFGVFREPGRPRLTFSAVHRSLTGDADGFVTWRNAVFGHGVFKHDRAWYAGETLRWLPRLHDMLDALQPALAGRRLVARTAGGEEVDWHGCDFAPLRDRHAHQSAGEPLPMFLVSDAGAELPLGPLLSVQTCGVCHEPAAFFFSKYQSRNARTTLLEYWQGHHGEQKRWAEVGRLEGHLPAGFVWERRVYDSGEGLDGSAIAFRDFEADYVRPDYLLDALWRDIDGRPGGYLLLTGPAGVGKSYLVRGLAEKEERGTKVLGYHVRHGATGDLQHFAIGLRNEVGERLKADTIDLQLSAGDTPARLQAELADYLTRVMRHKHLDTLILAIDGLDNSPEADATTPLIVDLLPDAAVLPPGCFVVLTTRAECPARVAANLDRLRRAGPEGCVEWRLDPGAEGNARLVRAYLTEHLPPSLRGEASVAEVLRRSGGVFLYAAHYCRALAGGAFETVEALPAAEAFYPVFLARLRERVGPALYEGAYLPLLLTLAAARVPVTREQLEGWVQPADRLAAALAELADFVRVERVRGWHEGLSDEPRYSLAHEGFVRYAEAELGEGLRRCHAVMAARAMRRAPDWEADIEDDGELYDLRFVAVHARLAGSEVAERLELDETWARGCCEAGNILHEKTRYRLASELRAIMVGVFRRLVSGSRVELEADLASGLLQWGNSLLELGRPESALALFDDSIECYAKVYESCKSVNIIGISTALGGRGVALTRIGRLKDAMEAHRVVVASFRELVESGHSELEDQLAFALNLQGGTLFSLGRLGEAAEIFDEAITLLRRLVRGGRSELEVDLAHALMNRCVTEDNMGWPVDTITYHDEAVVALRHLVERGRAELENDLARALMHRGNAEIRLDRPAEALASYEEAVRILHQLVLSGRTELEGGLARVLWNRGNAEDRLELSVEALKSLTESVGIFRRLVESGRADLEADLARVLISRGHTFRVLDRRADGLADCGEAIGIFRQLVEGGRVEMEDDLARALMSKGTALVPVERIEEALACFGEGIHQFESCCSRGEVQAFPLLIGAREMRFITLASLGRWSGADVLATLHDISVLSRASLEPFLQKCLWVLDEVRSLTPDHRETLVSLLGEQADIVRDLLDHKPLADDAAEST